MRAKTFHNLLCVIATLAVSTCSCSSQDTERQKELAEVRAEAAKLAATTRDERRASWSDDVVEVDGPSIETLLPQLSTVRTISGLFYDSDLKTVEINIPASHSRAFVELLADSQPVELESEIWTIGIVKMTTADGQRYGLTILSNFANPIIYRVRKPNGDWQHYATLRSEPEVLAFFESFQDNKNRQNLRGYYSM
jgi:hypothetical protein